MSGPKSRPLPDPVAAWAQHRRAAGIAEGTIVVHACYLTRLAEAHDLDTVTAEDLVSWLAAHRWQVATRKSVRSALRTYFRWARRTGRREDDPSDLLDRVRTPPPCPRPVPEDALAAALRHPDPDVRLMVLAAAYAGLRRAEIARMHRDDLDGDLLRITGKGGKTRVVPIGGDLLRELQARPDGWIFPGRFGSHVCPDMVGKRLAGVLPVGYTGHKLRHRYATRVHNATRDLLSVQALLGHSSPETTRAYVLTDLDQLRRAAATALG